jgi:hypothetical protein
LNRYDGFDPRLAVAQAVSRGLIAPDEVSEELAEIIAPLLTALRAQLDDEGYPNSAIRSEGI